MKNDEKSKINFDKVIGTANTGMSTEDIMSFFRNSPLMDRIDLDTARVPACEMREIDTSEMWSCDSENIITEIIFISCSSQ